MLKSQRQKDVLFDSLIYTVLFIIMLSMLYPFYYVLIASFNKGSDTLLGGVYYGLEVLRWRTTGSSWRTRDGIAPSWSQLPGPFPAQRWDFC